MGIEGEKLVFDYLSRVGDLAHGTSMSAADRAALVNRLRDEIGQQRSEAGGAESRGQVKRILGRIGRPEDVVAAAADTPPAPAGPSAPAPAAAVPPSRSPEVPVEPTRRARRTRRGRTTTSTEPIESTQPIDATQPTQPVSPVSPGDPAEDDGRWPDGPIGRFVGGIEIPEMLRPPTERDDAEPDPDREPGVKLGKANDAAVEAEDAEDPDGVEGPTTPATPAAPAAPTPAPSRAHLWRPRLRRTLGTRRVGGPFELVAAVALTAGAVVGSLYPLALGWLISYWSPRLSRREAQWATFGMPGLVAGGYAAWLFGRANGHWGEPLVEGAAGGALADHWPMLLRGSALASAAFLFWRARRPRPPANG